MRRFLAVAGVLVVIGAAGVTDALVSRGPVPGSNVQPAIAYAVSSGAAESSAWTCPGASGRSGPDPARVVMTNASGHALDATITAVSSGGERKSAPLSIPAGGQVAVVPATMVQGAWVGATVLIDGGGASVFDVAGSASAYSVAPCASTPSTNWYFAGGSTSGGRSLDLALMDPGDTSAVVDLSFSTGAGTTSPSSLQGIMVPAGALRVIDLGRHLRGKRIIATSVTALSGTIVATETERSGPSGSVGMAMWLGATAPATSWSLPTTTDARGSLVSVDIYNPSRHAARVRLRAAAGLAGLATFARTVPPRSVYRFVTTAEHAIAFDTPFSLEVLSTNGVGVVVERSVSANPAAPVPRYGATSAMPLSANHWIVPAVTPPGDAAWSLTVSDLAGHAVTASVMALDAVAGQALLTPVPGLFRRTVTPSAALSTVDMPGAPIGTQPLEVIASGPVAVALDALPSGSPGVVTMPCFPTAQGFPASSGAG